MGWIKYKIKTELKVTLLLLLAFSAIAFVEKKYDEKACQEIDIYIHNVGNDFFLDSDDIYKLITADESDLIIGTSYNKIDLRSIEKRINQNEYVENSQAYIDLTGHITVDVSLNRPIARFLLPGKKDKYLCANDKIIQTSDHYTSRVLLVNGAFLNNKNLDDSINDPTYLHIRELIHFIYDDEFWRAQIAQIEIDKKGYILLYPQVTKQNIEFGKAENIEEKFKKLHYFYKRILPEKGWNTYARVNIEYENQIICE